LDTALANDDMAERRRDALSDRVAAGVQHHFADIVDFDASIFPRADAAGFDAAADADADVQLGNFLLELMRQ
jgi:hypothetical protein